MNFASKIHCQLFREAVKNRGDSDPKVLSAIYLLTAQRRLWSKVKPHVLKNEILFADMAHTGYTPSEYTLINCAKDICIGTQAVSLSELSNDRIISPQMYDLIITALRIARTGIYTGKRRKGGPN